MEIQPDTLERLRTLDEVLKTEIRGQDHVLPRIASVIRRGELGISKPGRPRGSLLLLGPTGVGKTETVIVATRHVLGADRLFRLDMSEYQTQDAIGLLLGREPGERGFLGAVRAKAEVGSLLFDEVEKAHPRVLDLFLQLLDAARITVATGETLDFSGYYIWMTSNLGAADVMQLQHSSETASERHVLSMAEQNLRPEFVARIQEKLVYRRLGYDHQLEIAAKFLQRELDFLATCGIHLTASPDVLPFLVRLGFHPKLGARPMRDLVERMVGDAVGRRSLYHCSRVHQGVVGVNEHEGILAVF